MSGLRRLELNLNYRVTTIFPNPPPPTTAGDIVPLSRLTDFIFRGHGSYLWILMVMLAAPSLQHLDTEYWGGDVAFPIPQLCKFICNSECQFNAVRLDFLRSNVKFSAETRSQSDHAQPFRITIPTDDPWEEIGQMLSGPFGQMLSRPLSTVEELVVGWEILPTSQQRHIHWRGFFNHTWRVKMVRVHYKVAVSVAHSFQLDGQDPALGLLPALEQVEIYCPVPESRRNGQYVAIRDAFKPLIATRQQEGRPIRLSWT